MRRYKTDIAIVGGGPAGLATAHALQSNGLEVAVFEKGSIADHVSRYPVFMTFFSTPDLIELAGFPLIVTHEKPTRQEYLNYLRRFVREMKLDIRTGHAIDRLEGERDDFTLVGSDRCGESFEVAAKRVVLATGAYATPKLLKVPGEDLPKVSHYYTEAHPYFASKVLIIGGRNSAVEIALELWRSGAEVTICHRDAEFGESVKYWLVPDINNRIAAGEIKAYMSSRVSEIRPGSVVIDREGEGPIETENDFVLALTGYRPDPGLLERFGVKPEPGSQKPVFDPETLESQRPGLYMAGVMLAGEVSSRIFIENSRTHGEQILKHLQNGASIKAGT